MLFTIFIVLDICTNGALATVDKNCQCLSMSQDSGTGLLVVIVFCIAMHS